MLLLPKLQSTEGLQTPLTHMQSLLINGYRNIDYASVSVYEQ